MKPFQQGDLDGLCGIYSIINSVKLVAGKMPTNDCYDLFYKILQQIEETDQLSAIIVNGCNINQLGCIFKNVIEKKYPNIKRSKPFHKRKDASIDEFWDTTYQFLTHPNRAVMVGLTSEYGHWTVIRSMSHRRIYFWDSYGMQFMNRANCTVETLYPYYTYFFERKR